MRGRGDGGFCGVVGVWLVGFLSVFTDVAEVVAALIRKC